MNLTSGILPAKSNAQAIHHYTSLVSVQAIDILAANAGVMLNEHKNESEVF